MSREYTHLPDALHDLITAEEIPETYTEIKNELQWYTDILNDRESTSFVDVAECFAGCNHSNSSDTWEFSDLYERFAENRETLEERLGDDDWGTVVRVLHLAVALEDRVEDRVHLRKYKNNKPGTSGTFYDMGHVQARLNARVYRLTDASSAVFSNQQYFGGMVAVGSGTWDVAFPRNVDGWFDRHYGEYMTAEEVREYKNSPEAKA